MSSSYQPAKADLAEYLHKFSAIHRNRQFRTDFVLNRAVLYSILGGIAILGYGFLVSGIALILGDLLNLTNPFVAGLLIFLLALSLIPLRNRLQALIDHHFFHERIDYKEIQRLFGHELTQVTGISEILELLRRTVDQVLRPVAIHIYLFDPVNGHYRVRKGEDRNVTSDLRFPVTSALVRMLHEKNDPLILADPGKMPAELQPEQARLSMLGSVVFMPIPGATELMGWLALGPRCSGHTYNQMDLKFLQGLCNQAALVVERYLVLKDLERRVREMNVLTRVAQGVSFTLEFDDILELISAQTNQVLPARIFHVTLIEEDTGSIFYAFCEENDERLTEREGRPLYAGQGLDVEVITNQKSIRTDDYERECRLRGLLVDISGIYSWLGVPLNAGAETIGAISIASRDPLVSYTAEHCNLLQAIADQTAGAIVKARSLVESEQRARQLAKLNELGMSLTFTLDLKALLRQIMQGAVEILNCNAGSLFLVDPQTDELIFEVVLGPVAEKLAGRRLPPGTGLVGESQQSGQPIIANEAKRSREWFDEIDAQTGFDTQDMLVVPMRIQDRVIGVIEVIDKKDGAPFTYSDQVLLTAFISQATIAIENARLYTMTDQALAATVQELEVMQRIDRELNASLDIEHAMRLTLEWAMRRSYAEIGLVGTVDDKGVQVIVAQGDWHALAGFLRMDQDTDRQNGSSEDKNGLVRSDRSDAEQDSNYLSFSLDNRPALRQAIESGQIVCHIANDTQAGNPSGLAATPRRQIVVPIRRETNTIGILLLESTGSEPFKEEMISFLTRLSDHAAIAIANAQLYNEIKQANLAKSRFVSFVAHELKNPMASIKGYTELVSSGMAGTINEMQASFLATVRSNVDRMNSIVSDLNDLTKIQVGNLRLEFRTVQIPEVLEDVLRSLKRQVEETHQQMVISLEEDLTAVWADPARLAQILTNLISNASKYTLEGGRFVIGAERYAEADGMLAGAEFVHLWVQDFGIGISDEDQKKIFQQYFRTDTAKEMASGTGLGLSITKSLVELQGGRIWFESAFGTGTTFHFTIPTVETQ